MFFGDYSFFDYKLNINGYTGQDYGGFATMHFLMVFIGLLLIVSARKPLSFSIVKEGFLFVHLAPKTTARLPDFCKFRCIIRHIRKENRV